MHAHRLVIVAVVVAVLALGACGSSSHDSAPKGVGPNSTSFDPGPNSTQFDPGPNPTDNGPQTVDGTLHMTAKCFTLQRPDGPLDLRFQGYTNNGGALADDTHTTVAH